MKFRALLLLLFPICYLQAQEKEPIQADRPDQTETPAIVPKGMFQVETGFTYEKTNPDQESYALPSILWKYGVNENFELRLITQYVVDRASFSKTSGLSPLLIGCKIKISDEKGIFPKTSFIGHIALPNAASTAYKIDHVAP